MLCDTAVTKLLNERPSEEEVPSAIGDDRWRRGRARGRATTAATHRRQHQNLRRRGSSAASANWQHNDWRRLRRRRWRRLRRRACNDDDGRRRMRWRRLRRWVPVRRPVHVHLHLGFRRRLRLRGFDDDGRQYWRHAVSDTGGDREHWSTADSAYSCIWAMSMIQYGRLTTVGKRLEIPRTSCQGFNFHNKCCTALIVYRRLTKGSQNRF